MEIQLNLESEVTLVFKHPDGMIKELCVTVDDLLNKSIDEFHDDLEGGCTSGCYNESQNHCECDPEYIDYEFNSIKITTEA